jgi:hypothetical protein
LLTEAGEETETVDVMHYIWTGSWPENRTPRVDSIQLDGKGHKESVVLESGKVYDAVFEVFDHEGDPLTFRWEVKPESESKRGNTVGQRSCKHHDNGTRPGQIPIVRLCIRRPGSRGARQHSLPGRVKR